MKRLTGIDASEARREAERVGKELEAVERGVPSAPVYVGKGSLRLGTAGTVVEGPGLLFLRVVDVRPRPFDEVKGRIRRSCAGRKLAEVIGQVKKKLEEQGNLRVVPGAF